MSLTLQPVRVATGSDEEGMLVFTDEQRLVAVLTPSGNSTRVLQGTKAGSGRLVNQTIPIFLVALTPCNAHSTRRP